MIYFSSKYMHLNCTIRCWIDKYAFKFLCNIFLRHCPGHTCSICAYFLDMLCCCISTWARIAYASLLAYQKYILSNKVWRMLFFRHRGQTLTSASMACKNKNKIVFIYRINRIILFFLLNCFNHTWNNLLNNMLGCSIFSHKYVFIYISVYYMYIFIYT